MSVIVNTISSTSDSMNYSTTQLRELDEEHGEKNNNDDDGAKAIHIETTAVAGKRTKTFIVLVALCAALGGLIFGYDIAGAGGTFLMAGFQQHFGWDTATTSEVNRDQGLINGLPTITGDVSVSLRQLLFLFLVACLQAAAPTMDMMFAGRIFAGLGIGGLSFAVPVYITECAPEHVRGQLATLWQLAVTAGILIASAANMGLEKWDQGWRLSYGGNIIFAVILAIALIFMPESPRWLTANGFDDSAREVMTRIRYEDEIEDEIIELKAESKEEKELGVSSWREVFAVENKMRYRLLLGIGLQTAQQLCGINAIMFYAPTILKNFFGESESIIGTFILNVINFASTFITIYAVERCGRVKLLVSGGIIMLLALILNAFLASVAQTETIGYIVVLFSALFIVGFAFSWGPVVWVVCAEFFPLRARGKATGLTTMTNWAWTTIVGALFPMASTASLSGCFVFIAVAILFGTVIVYLFQAETANKTILEIDSAYAAHKPKIARKEW